MNPLFLIPALMGGAGAYINSRIQNQAIAAQNAENQRAMAMERAARLAESERQAVMEQLQADAVAKALFKVDPGDTAKTVEAEASDPDNAITVSAEEYNIPSLTGQSQTGVVAGEIGKLVADKLKQTKDILKAQATLSGQGTSLLGNQDALLRMAGDVQNVGRDRAGSLAASRLETSIPAARVTPSDSPIGDILMLGGQLLGGMGGFGSLAGGPLVAPGTASMVTPSMASGSIFGAPLAIPSSGLPALY